MSIFKVSSAESKNRVEPTKAIEAELDMYADDFEVKAKEQKERREEEAASVDAQPKSESEGGGYVKGNFSSHEDRHY